MKQRNGEESIHQSPGHLHHIQTQPKIVQYPKNQGNGLDLNNFYTFSNVL